MTLLLIWTDVPRLHRRKPLNFINSREILSFCVACTNIGLFKATYLSWLGLQPRAVHWFSKYNQSNTHMSSYPPHYRRFTSSLIWRSDTIIQLKCGEFQDRLIVSPSYGFLYWQESIFRMEHHPVVQQDNVSSVITEIHFAGRQVYRQQNFIYIYIYIFAKPKWMDSSQCSIKINWLSYVAHWTHTGVWTTIGHT